MLVAIAGGGIAGLTAAIALAARGPSVELFERAERLEEIGAGIQLSPNATAVLARLGVLDGLAAKASEPEALVIRDARSGGLLVNLPLGRAARARYGAPYYTLHRADLQAALLEAARRYPAISLNLGAEVKDVRATETKVAFTTGRDSHSCDALVAADGIHSAIRATFFSHPGSRPFGRSAWRAILPAKDIAGRAALDHVGLWLGAGAHLVHYPVAKGEALNVVVIAADETSEPPDTSFGAKARRIIEAVSSWTRSPLAEVDPTRSWAIGRVVLVGDAAHAMAPSAAQGGAMAIEDAWVLAESLTRIGDDPAPALVAYERARRPRVERVARMASHNLNLYEARGVPAIARNLGLKVLPARLFRARLDWLFGWRS